MRNVSASPSVIGRKSGIVEAGIILVLISFILVLTISGITGALLDNNWVPLWQCLAAGFTTGYLLGISKSSAGRSFLIVAALGLLFVILFSTRVKSQFLDVFTSMNSSLNSQSPLFNPGIDYISLNKQGLSLLKSITAIFERIITWLSSLVSGKPLIDPVALVIAWAMLIWLISAWAGWVIKTKQDPLLAVLPALLINLGTLSSSTHVPFSTYIILGAILVLIAVVQFNRHENRWLHAGIPYPERKYRHIGAVATLCATVLVFLSVFISTLSFNKVIEWTTNQLGPASPGENTLVESLGIRRTLNSLPNQFTAYQNPGLPNDHLIGSGPELSQELVMSVEVLELPPLRGSAQPVPFYWRGYTYDIYTGTGWNSSTAKQEYYEAGQPFRAGDLSAKTIARLMVRPVPGTDRTIFSAGDPVSVNIPSMAAWRSPSDLFGIQKEGAGSYKIQTLLPLIDENGLKNAGFNYPTSITRRFLMLPAGLPQRVKELAIRLTATEPTLYDRVIAIEQFLRNYEYSLQVDRPPPTQDLVDYFLFESRKGYCDYYASAMVVMARAAGIPARLAVGYASGTYNLKLKRFVVSRADAHAWPEIYFPGIGWVPFEPTASQPTLHRPEQVAVVDSNLSPLRTNQDDEIWKPKNFVSYAGLGFLSMILIGVAWVILDEMRLKKLKPQLAAIEIYRRLRSYGILLKIPFERGETVDEFRLLLIDRTKIIYKAKEASLSSLIHDINTLCNNIIFLVYRPILGEGHFENNLIANWKALRWHLRFIWIIGIWNTLLRKITRIFTGFPLNKARQS